ncbi:hypothetical protein JW960_18330 [candidate division KSB1 bacterium]|nr:hypothetical protein [candidate division KSB1 bacterium]
MPKIQFIKHKLNPIIPRTPNTFYSKYSANPDLLEFQGKYFFYFRGQNEKGADQIGVGYTHIDKFDGINWIVPDENPIIPISSDPSAFDSGYILDPAAIVINGKVHLYYTAHRSDWQSWNIPSHIGLAISDDGFHFKKSTHNPLIVGMAPEIVFHNNRFYLFFQKFESDGRLHIFCCPSDDGLHFNEKNQQKVFSPFVVPNSFDCYSISTVRIWREKDRYFMTYGGCNRYIDYPIAFGLARSKDLMHWERYPHNPILERGTAGEWDEGAIWFATVFKKDDVHYLWYEGNGTGLGVSDEHARQASSECRDQDYGGYGINSFSQIGLATFMGDICQW